MLVWVSMFGLKGGEPAVRSGVWALVLGGLGFGVVRLTLNDGKLTLGDADDVLSVEICFSVVDAVDCLAVWGAIDRDGCVIAEWQFVF